MTAQTIQVAGMTCAHCVRFVTTELEQLPGVTAIAVDLPTGAVTITTTQPLLPDQLHTAIEEAGYELTSPPRD
ncbi:heavy-metal-associated domain-containing protein [Kribbella sancticallisti]|uniref:Heavy-metal-associated domain-containing protein n=1 Tax=Kribbella sancticallisti TaxID=460087 RepID=A0ABP4Q953_9ACTN